MVHTWPTRDIRAISKEQFLAELKKVGEDMLAGKLVEPGLLFNMNYVRNKFECGTAMCIGGWTEYRLGVVDGQSGDLMDRWSLAKRRSRLLGDEYDQRLHNLFYTWPWSSSGSKEYTDLTAAGHAIAAYFDRPDLKNPWHVLPDYKD